MQKQKTNSVGFGVTILEKILKWGIVGMLTVMPLLYSNGRIASAVTSKQFFVIGMIDLLVVVWVWLMTTQRRYWPTIKNLLFMVPATLFVGSIAISTFTGVDFYTSVFSTIERGGGLLFMVHMYVFALMIISLVRVQGESFVKSCFQAILFSAVGVAILTFFTREAFDIGVDWLNNSVGGATLGNSTIAGAYFVFALFGTGFIWVKETVMWKKVLYVLGSLVIVLSPILFNVKDFFVTKIAWGQMMHNPLIVIGQARAAALSIIIGIVITFLVFLVVNSQRKPIKVIASIGIILIFTGIGYAGYQVLQDGSRIQQVFMDKVGENRITFWHEAFAGIHERPWFGWGPENFRIVHQKYFDPVLSGPSRNAETWVDKPHNTVIETVVTQGYVGLITYILFIGLLIVGSIRLVYSKVLNNKQGAILVGLLAAYLLQNQLAFDSIISFVCVWLLVGIVAGYIDQSNNESGHIPYENVFKAVAAGVTVTALVVWLYAAYYPSRKMVMAQEVFNSPITVRPELYAELFTGHGSLQLNTDLGMMLYTLAESYLSQRATIMQDPQSIAAVSHEADKLLDAMDSVSNYSENDYRFKVSGAIFQETQVAVTEKLDATRVERMNRYAREAIALSPGNPFAYMIYAKILLYTNNIAEARTVIDKVLSLNPTIKEAHIQKISFEKTYGTKAQQQTAIADFLRYFPDGMDMIRK